jgi:hypothetical protein
MANSNVAVDPDPYPASQNEGDPDRQHWLTVTVYYAKLFEFSVELS